MIATLDWLTLLTAYLLGSIPSAQLAAHVFTGKDIRLMGDDNMGGKNVFLSVGRIAGVGVTLVDIAKGALAIALARHIGASEMVILLAGACVVLGHDFPVFGGFRGGQGMATILGVFGLLFPLETLVALAVLPVVLLVTHNWDASCAAACAALVAMMTLTGQPPKRLLYIVLILPTIGVRKIMQARGAHHATI